MIWSNKAFDIYMGDAMAQEPEAGRDRDVMHAEAPHARDVMLTNAAGVHTVEDLAACEAALEARRSGSLVARPVRG